MRTDPSLPINLSNPPHSRATGHKSRHVARLSNVPFLGRSAWMSRVQQIAAQAPPEAPFPRLLAFLQFWKWLLPYLREFVHRTAPYQTYFNGQTGIFRMGLPATGPLRLAVASDWGTGTLEAETVANNMRMCAPQVTVHLGDVYYMGEISEINENCLGERTKDYHGVLWPRGSLGSLALLGNHEMYSGGHGYFRDFLPKLGLLNADGSLKTSQSASYFCLETPCWVVLGLDTGYHSGGVPAFTSIPMVNSIPSLNVDARFDDKMMLWLRQTMESLQRNGAGDKPIVVLTHHQPLSCFEHAFRKPARQLAESGFFHGKEIVWLYGHEHRLTVYAKQPVAEGLTAYPRCIGHGGMPVELTQLSKPNPNILYYDPREHPIDKEDPNIRVGYNGHVVLVFEGVQLTIEYHDILENALLLAETFTPNGSGKLLCTAYRPAGSSLTNGSTSG